MKRYKSAAIYASIYFIYIAVYIALVHISKGLQAWDVYPRLALLAAIYILLGVTIAVRVGLCVGFPTKAQRIVLPTVFAAVSIAISLWLFFNLYGSYKYFWTIAAADIASIFIALAKKQ